MNIVIRTETPADFKEVHNLVEIAFRTDEFSDHREHLLVERLRKSEAFVPELSVVAEKEKVIAGHILLTKIFIRNELESFSSLALAPVAVLPEFQNQGIGGKLINYAHAKAADLGFTSVVVLGHADYYPRFGYKRADLFGIKLPFEAPAENIMAVELIPGALKKVSGVVEYAEEFFQ
jgi:predicted N-acetyltransferase YhbS